MGLVVVAFAPGAPAQKRNWYFDTDGNTEGWGAARHNITAPTTAGGALNFTITGTDPYIYSPGALNISASQYQFIKLVMKTDFANQTGQIYWGTSASPVFAEDKVAYFSIKQAGSFQTYYIEMDTQPNWTGTLLQFRIDPGNGPTGQVWIDEVLVISAAEMPPRADILSFTYPDSLLLTAGHPATLAARVKNTGKNVIQNLDATLQLPAGVTLLSGTAVTTIPSLAMGEEAALSWSIQCSGPLVAEGSLTASVGGLTLAAKKTPLFGVSQELEVVPGAPTGLQSIDDPRYIALQNNLVRLLIQKETNPATTYGPIHYEYWREGAWHRIATCPAFSSMIYDGTGLHGSYLSLEPGAWQVESQTADLIRLRFSGAKTDSEDRTFNYEYRIALGANSAQADFAWRLSADAAFGLGRFDGPIFYCGGEPALTRDEAIFPGLEFLEANEQSSSDDFNHTDHHLRYIPHPYKITQPYIALRFGDVLLTGLWDINQAWNGAGAKLPLAFFASPDTFYGRPQSHFMGLFLPGYSAGFVENAREAGTPQPVGAGENLNLTFSLWLKTGAASALEATQYYFAQNGTPEPDPYPFGGIQGCLKTAMEAFMDSLWVPATQEWNTSLGLIMSTGRDPSFTAALWRTSQIVDDPILAAQYYDRATSVWELPDTPRQGPMLSYLSGAPSSYVIGQRAWADVVLPQRTSEGLWVFDNDTTHSELTETKDWHEIGPDNASELGSSTPQVLRLMEYALASGDQDIVEALEPTLQAMKRFKVPRGVSIWEIPLRTPETVAASDATEIYTIAYRLTGREEYRDLARYWALSQLNFVFTWELPQYPFMLYDTIPVYGATWYTGSWHGRPVQWQGIEMAHSLLTIAQIDDTLDWRKIARGLLTSGCLQFRLEPGWHGLFPDSWDLMNGTFSTFLLSPGRIAAGLSDLLGYPLTQTTIVPTGEGDIHISALGEVLNATVTPQGSGWRLSFDLRHTPRQRIFTLVSGPAQPTAVLRKGIALPIAASLYYTNPEGYRFVSPALTEIASDFADGDTVHYDLDYFTLVRNRARLAATTNLPTLFDTDTDFEGWLMAHHLTNYNVRSGALGFLTNGNDPYFQTSSLAMPDQFDHVLLRMKISAGSGAQFFWHHALDPVFTAAKQMVFTATPDGQYHTYQIHTGIHTEWAGKTITGLRIDPNSVSGSSGAVDWFTLGNLSDYDGDAMPDAWEGRYGLNDQDPEDGAADADADGLTNAQEYLHRTHPGRPDSDFDGYTDADELRLGSDPTDIASKPAAIANPVWSLNFAGGATHGWTGGVAPPAGMSEATTAAGAVGLEVQSVNNNCAGGWTSPATLVVSPRVVYVVEAVVAGQAIAPSAVPRLVLRALAEDGSFDAAYEVASDTVNNYAPPADGRRYYFAFQPVEGTRRCRLRFELWNTDPADDPYGYLILKSLDVRAYPESIFDPAYPVVLYDFRSSQKNWTWAGTAAGFTEPMHEYQKGLIIQATNNTSNFGSWTKVEDGLIIDAGGFYQADFAVATNAADGAESPSPGVGLTSPAPSTRATLRLNSTRTDWPMQPAHNERLRVFLYAPASLDGTDRLTANFDLYNTDSNDRPDASLSLTSFSLGPTIIPADARPEPAPLVVPASLGSIVWADFAHAGPWWGTQANPFNMIGEAVATVPAAGIIRIKGDTALNPPPDHPRITKAMRLEAVGGPVRIGQ
ncbi:MAG: thrombospondin type 3 repeat-containing protein [bacterium]|nr:thrombospondin type 3 repeat-containing protein [bacterium]